MTDAELLAACKPGWWGLDERDGLVVITVADDSEITAKTFRGAFAKLLRLMRTMKERVT